MNLLDAFHGLNYEDVIQLDGAFSVAHINYMCSPQFGKCDGKDLAKESRKNSITEKECVEDVIKMLVTFRGTEEDYSQEDCVSQWKYFWISYIQAFNSLSKSNPRSIVTVHVGRQAIEIGFKYLLFKKNYSVQITHNLGNLADEVFVAYDVKDSYMAWIPEFCRCYREYIEGGMDEYFRYPEYERKNKKYFFAGNRLAISWLSYNFALILAKLICFAGLGEEYLSDC